MATELTYRALEIEVIRWAEARKIIPNSTPVAQSRKTLEEAGELLEAASKLKVLSDMQKMFPHIAESYPFQEYLEKAKDEFSDAVGDCYVTIINACALADVDAVECLGKAYNTIKNRKGTLLPNGVFQKEE